MNRTFLIAADVAQQCQHRCKLRLRLLDGESGASAVLAAAPLLGMNTLRLQLPMKQGCSLSLEAACDAGRSCHASGQVVVDGVDMLQQHAANADHDRDSTSTAATLLTQSIVVQHVASDAVSTATAVDARQSMRLASVSTKQLVLTIISVVALTGLQGCLLHRVRDQRRLQSAMLLTRMHA